MERLSLSNASQTNEPHILHHTGHPASGRLQAWEICLSQLNRLYSQVHMQSSQMVPGECTCRIHLETKSFRTVSFKFQDYPKNLPALSWTNTSPSTTFSLL